MNKEWSDKNKKMQLLIGRKDTFSEGIETLMDLRNDVFSQISSIVHTYPADAYHKMPYPTANGFHNKTLAYSMWHIFRIEDIVANTLIANETQVLFTDDWLKRIGSPIITTGNELQGEQIAEFSKQLNIKELYLYCKAVRAKTEEKLRKLEYSDLKRRFGEEDRERLILSNCVDSYDNYSGLIDYWCGKDVAGLIRMPFSRHWIMHVEAMRRIKNRLCEIARKGVDQIAYCGLSCDHCFYSAWCGSCRTSYNTCSNATMYPDNICPNSACCRERNLDGCYECKDIENCHTGFYSSRKGNAIKAQAFFINKYGKKELKKVLDNLHSKYEFKWIQEIIGYDPLEGLKILEEHR